MKTRPGYATIAILLLIAISAGACANDKGVNDLRGQWLFTLTHANGDPYLPLTLFINDVEPGPEQDTYLAAGCMRSPDQEELYPLALKAIYDAGANSYSLSVYATVLESIGDGLPGAYVIQFTGTIEVNGAAVNDDLARGDFRSGGPSGTWQATHQNRRRTNCPPVDTGGERLAMDVSAHRWLDEIPSYQLEATGITIVASALQITAPDDEVIIAPMHTDMWSPDADLITVFRFRTVVDNALPIPGQPYRFVLLDVLGKPIPGTETYDIWTHCSDIGPSDLQVSPNPAIGEDLVLSWIGIPNVPGEFIPGQAGYYQLSIDPVSGIGESFGADSIGATYHVIPWNPFVPDQAGSPDGRNLGVSLGSLVDGEYAINVFALSYADPANGGFGQECIVGYQSEVLRLEKRGNVLSISSRK